jgi:hypothetical protein
MQFELLGPVAVSRRVSALRLVDLARTGLDVLGEEGPGVEAAVP